METYIVYPSAEQAQAVVDFMNSLNIRFEKKDENDLPAHVMQGIRKGQQDIEVGRSISLEAFKEKFMH